MRQRDAARISKARILAGLLTLVGIGCAAVAIFAYPAAGKAGVCTDELYPPQSASALGSWVSSLGKGHVGCLHAGTYGSSGQAVYVNPSVAGRSETDRVRVRGYPGEALPQIVGGIYFSSSADYYTVRLLKVDGSSFGDDTIGLPRGADHIWLSDLDITNQNRLGVHGCITSGGTALIVNRDLIHRCGGASNKDHCVYLGHGRGAIVANSVIYGCGAYAVSLYTDPDYAYVHNNVLDSSGHGVMFGGGSFNGSCEATDAARVQNNAITNSNGGTTSDQAVQSYWDCGLKGVGNILQGNCLWANARGDLNLAAGGVSTSGNIDADPRYQPGRHIPSSSPCHSLVGDPAAGLLVTRGNSPSNLSAAAPCAMTGAPASYDHVVWVVFENRADSQIIGSSSAPYFNALASKCGLATNFYAETHPSLPNYIAMTSGSTQGITDDADPASHQLNVPSIFSQLEPSGWRSLQESMPSNCSRTSSGNYAPKHNPAAYFTNISCGANDVPLSSVPDVSARFTFVTPNLCHDMHDCSVSTGDAWLAGFLPKVLDSNEYRAGKTAVFVTFDEDDRSASNQITTIVIGPSVPTGARSGMRFDHYAMLRTTEELLGLGYVGAAASAPSMRAAFGL
jgi:hypothetical protein